MSSGFAISVNMRKLEGQIGSLARRVDDFSPVADDFGAHMVRTWTLKFPRTPHGTASVPGEPPAVQNAGLRNSLTHEVRAGGDVVEIGTPLKYGGIQHTGGEIRPVRARALTVPIDPRAYGKRAKDFPDIFRVAAKPGQEPEDLGVLAIEGSDDNIIPLFALRTKVRLPARPWRIIYPEDLEYLGRRMERHLESERN